MSSPTDSMSSTEQMRYWMDVVDGKIVATDGHEVESVTEAADKSMAVIIMKRVDADRT
jgi:hypothetical protein